MLQIPCSDPTSLLAGDDLFNSGRHKVTELLGREQPNQNRGTQTSLGEDWSLQAASDSQASCPLFCP